MDHYAVIGYPIEHSLSPHIHRQFAEQTGQDIDYKAISSKPEHFRTTVEAFRQQGGCGLNVTLPFKRQAWVYADHITLRADRAQAVNTLSFKTSGEVIGDNTDGVGLLRDLTIHHGLSLKGLRIAILGAGGATRGILEPLLAESPRSLLIANRTVEKALDLAFRFGDLGPVSGIGLVELKGQTIDLIINATAASLQSDTLPLPDDVTVEWAYDLMYSAQPTAFMRWAQQHGAQGVADGLGMLVEQAAESFYVWRGVKPDTAPVLQKIRHLLNGK